MTDLPDHKTIVGLSMIALARERGFLEGGAFTPQVTSTELLPGGVQASKEEAVDAAIDLMSAGGGMGNDEQTMRTFLGVLYEQLAELAEPRGSA